MISVKRGIQVLFVAFLCAQFFSFKTLNIRTSGSPGGYSGSLVHGRTCGSNGGCHGGGFTTANVQVTSTIPAGGYEEGESYEITVSTTVSGFSKFGFELFAESETPSALGSWVITDAARTRTTGSSVTHTSSGSAAPTSGTTSWQVNWVAPSGSQGPVTFHCTVLAANGNGSTSGDQVFKGTLTAEQASNPCTIPVIDITEQEVTLCKDSTYSFSLANSLQGLNYLFIDDSESAVSPLVAGNGGTLVLTTFPITTEKEIRLKAVQGECEQIMNGSRTLLFSPDPEQEIALEGTTLFGDFLSSSYQWVKDGVVIPNATDSLFLAEESGNYQLQYTGPNGCPWTTNILAVEIEVPCTFTTPTKTVDAPFVCLGETGSILVSNTEAVGYALLNESFQGVSDTLIGGSGELVFSTPAINASSAFYLIGVRDPDCSIRFPDSLVINVFPAANTLLSVGDTLICEGDALSVKPQAPGVSDFNWMDGSSLDSIVVNQAGEVYFSGLDEFGCGLKSDTISVTVKPEVMVNLSFDGTTVTASPAGVYNWYRDGAVLESASSDSIAFQGDGLYRAEMIDGPCLWQAEAFLNGIGIAEEGKSMWWYNPQSGILHFDAPVQEVVAYSLLGQTKQKQQHCQELNLNGLNGEVVLVRWLTTKGGVETLKLKTP